MTKQTVTYTTYQGGGAGLKANGIQTVVETFVNESGWYRVWSDGWIEQGGIWHTTQGTGKQTITLLKPMRDLNYQIHLQSGDNTGGNAYYYENAYAYNYQFWSKTTSSFQTNVSSTSVSWGKCWEVKGYLDL